MYRKTYLRHLLYELFWLDPQLALIVQGNWAISQFLSPLVLVSKSLTSEVGLVINTPFLHLLSGCAKIINAIVVCIICSSD